MHEGFDRNRIRRHLLIFALSAPILAILTYFGLSQVSFNPVSNVIYLYICKAMFRPSHIWSCTSVIMRSKPTTCQFPTFLVSHILQFISFKILVTESNYLFVNCGYAASGFELAQDV